MALPTSGAISWSAIQTEHGGSNPISLSEYYGKYNVSNTQSPTSGAIDGSDLYGTSPSVAGGWTSYGAFDACTVSCGGGTQDQTRTCTSPAPSYGGVSCAGSATNQQACNTHSCVLTATSLSAFSGATVLDSGGKGVRWTSSGSWTFTVPDGITSARIHVIGAGGGPGSASGGCGAGAGGGGGYKTATLSQGQTYTVTVGNGGSAGYCTGSNGGSSSFGSLITANGGNAGRAGQSGCGFNYRPSGGSVSGATASSTGGTGGGNHDTNCGVFNGGSGGSYAGGGGGSANGWGCSCSTRGVGGSGGGYGGRGGNGSACYSGNENGLSYGGGAGGGWSGNRVGSKGVVILQWDTGITSAGG